MHNAIIWTLEVVIQASFIAGGILVRCLFTLIQATDTLMALIK